MKKSGRVRRTLGIDYFTFKVRLAFKSSVTCQVTSILWIIDDGDATSFKDLFVLVNF